MSVTPMSIYFFLLPSDRGVTVLHLVSDAIQNASIENLSKFGSKDTKKF